MRRNAAIALCNVSGCLLEGKERNSYADLARSWRRLGRGIEKSEAALDAWASSEREPQLHKIGAHRTPVSGMSSSPYPSDDDVAHLHAREQAGE